MSDYFSGVSNIRPYGVDKSDKVSDRKSRHHSERDDYISEQDSHGQDVEPQVLSIKAIILFLEDFLEARLGTSFVQEPPEVKNSFESWFDKKPSNLNEANQAYAYSSKIARRSYKGGSSTEERSSDLSNIYKLIIDLRALENDGVKVLRLVPDRDFIGGVTQSVENLMSSR